MSLNPESQPGDQQGAPVLNTPFLRDHSKLEEAATAKEHYHQFKLRSPNDPFFMRSILGPDSGIELDPSCPFQRAVPHLLDTPIVQRMRRIGQTSAAFLVYAGAEHSRFGHVVGSAHLTSRTLQALRRNSEVRVQDEIDTWGPIVVAFALTHDVGHVAPGSHLAQRVWFPDSPDLHEEISHRIIREDTYFRQLLDRTIGAGAAERLDLVMAEDESVPRWTWQLVTSGGWNTDRGDWVPRDSAHFGVTYGRFDNRVLIDRLRISPDGDLAIDPRGISSLESFMMCRAHMYRDVYQHDTARIIEQMHVLLGRRARELHAEGSLTFADEDMRSVLSAPTITSLSTPTILNMTNSWWGYHLEQWARPSEPDNILRDLASRLVHREPFKRFSPEEDTRLLVKKLVESSHLDPQYYYFELPAGSVKFESDLRSAPKVLTSQGVVPLTEYSDFAALLEGLKHLRGSPLIAAPIDIWREHSAH